MMMFSLSPKSWSRLAFDGGLGQHPGGLLERGRRQPALGGQRGLGDAHELGATLGRPLALLDQLAVDLGVDPGVDALAGQEGRLALLGHEHPAQHLAHDQLDVLVVDRHALVAVDLLDLFDEVLLGLADALDLEQLLGVLGPFDQGVTGGDLRPVGDLELGPEADVWTSSVPSSADHGDAAGRLLLLDADHAGVAGKHGGALGGAGLEELDHAGQAVGDVLTRDTAGVEGPHGQLGARLADRLGGDDADGLAELDWRAGGQGAPVAGAAHAVRALAGEHRAAGDLDDAGSSRRSAMICGEHLPASSTVPSESVTSRARARP